MFALVGLLVATHAGAALLNHAEPLNLLSTNAAQSAGSPQAGEAYQQGSEAHPQAAHPQSTQAQPQTTEGHTQATEAPPSPKGVTGGFSVAQNAAATAAPGDADRGRAIIIDRQRGMCLLCHSGPFAEEATPGNVSTDLTGVGSRYTRAQLLQRVADSRSLNPESIMPTYAQPSPAARVPPSRARQPLLSTQEIDDVVAFLMTLK